MEKHLETWLPGPVDDYKTIKRENSTTINRSVNLIKSRHPDRSACRDEKHLDILLTASFMIDLC
jgi:hypothetical protein